MSCEANWHQLLTNHFLISGEVVGRVLSVVLRYTDSDYSFGIFKLFLGFSKFTQGILGKTKNQKNIPM